MSVPVSAADVLAEHVVFELDCIDRVYGNAYVRKLTYPGGVASFFTHHRGARFPSTCLADPISKRFVASIYRFAAEREIPVVRFAKGQRKDDVAHEHLARFSEVEGIYMVGVAQEKTSTFRTEKRRNPETGATYPWIVRASALVNQYYLYGLDVDFGPFFVKFSSYFPSGAKLCINGHHWAQRQAQAAGIACTALDNGFLECDDPDALQRICDRLSPAKIDAFFRRWRARLPHPFTAADRRAGYRYELSILQAEFSLTQVLDRPHSGRVFCEQLIRENLDLGRPEKASLIFDRRVRLRGRRPTPSRWRTRVLTPGVTPSIHVEYKHSKIKQYHQLERAIRTETTINDTRDFAIGKRLRNLPALRQVGFQANRRLLATQRLGHDPIAAARMLHQVTDPVTIGDSRVAGLRFGDPSRDGTALAPGRVSPIRAGFHQPRFAFASRAPAGTPPRRHDRRTGHLRPAATARPRPDQTHPAHQPLPAHPGRFASGDRPHPNPRPTAQPRPSRRERSARGLPAPTPSTRQRPNGAQRLRHAPRTRRLKT